MQRITGEFPLPGNWRSTEAVTNLNKYLLAY